MINLQPYPAKRTLLTAISKTTLLKTHLIQLFKFYTMTYFFFYNFYFHYLKCKYSVMAKNLSMLRIKTKLS